MTFAQANQRTVFHIVRKRRWMAQSTAGAHWRAELWCGRNLGLTDVQLSFLSKPGRVCRRCLKAQRKREGEHGDKIRT